MRAVLLFLLMACWSWNIPAQDSPSGQSAGSDLLGTNAVRMVSPGQFELGDVRINKNERSISFPAEINMNSGMLEYLVVTTSGKTHESLLRTKTNPLHIQLAMLLINAKPGEFQIPKEIATAGAEKGEATPINDPSPVKLAGEAVRLEISWNLPGQKQSHQAEELLLNEETKEPIKNPKWIFNGSRVADKKFMAQVTGSIVSLITDPDAIINNQAPGHENDEVWGINTKLLPPVNHPVSVTIRLLQKASPTKQQP